MKRQVIDASKMNQIEMENTKKMMEMTSLMQRVGKGKRKYGIKLGYTARQVLARTLIEMKKLILSEGSLPKNLDEFIEHINGSKSSKNIIMSYDEISFLKSFLSLNISQQEAIKLPWYRIFSRFMNYLALVQYKEIIEKLKI